MKIAIRAHDYGKMTIEALSQQLAQDGFTGVQLVVNKALIDPLGKSLEVTQETALGIRHTLEHYNLEISLLGAYFNPLHTNPLLVQAGMDNFKNYLKLSPVFGCPYVGTETGSYVGDVWSFVPQNHSQEAFNRVVATFQELQPIAREHHACILIEPAFAHAIYSPDSLLQLMKHLDASVFGVTLDLFNLLNKDNYQDYEAILKDALQKLGPMIKVFHLKNFKVEQGTLSLCSLDEGYMDYDLILNHLRPFLHQATFILEGVKDKGILKSKRLIESFYCD